MKSSSFPRFAKQEGADAVIILPPYYFPLGEKSLESYFGMLAEALSDQPIYLYNFPDRTGYDLTPEITLRLVRKYKNIVGYKDTQAGMDHTRELIKLVKENSRNLKYTPVSMIILPII